MAYQSLFGYVAGFVTATIRRLPFLGRHQHFRIAHHLARRDVATVSFPGARAFFYVEK